MGFINVTRDELENLYAHDGITKKELRELLKINPNRITDKLSEFFRRELNPFRLSPTHKVDLRGFVHSPPRKLIKLFNRFHYPLISNIGKYRLLLLSSSPVNVDTFIPIIIPENITTPKDIGKAHFCSVNGKIHSIDEYLANSEPGIFLVVDDVNTLNFNDLFSISEPALKITDFADMVKDRFNSSSLITKGIIYWFMSSPLYNGRAGGNSLSPISPYDSKYKCNPEVLDEFQKEMLSIPLPYYTSKTSNRQRSIKFDYLGTMNLKLKHFSSPNLNYRYEADLERADMFLEARKPKNQNIEGELNLSTNSLTLDSIRTRPLESFFLEPLVPARVLTHTDLPILFSIDDIAIDKSETDLIDYSLDINQLIFTAKSTFPNSPYDPIDTAGAVKGLMDDVRKSFFELHELMIHGIIFNPGHRGGLGEHLTRLANSMLRGNDKLNEPEALARSELLFSEMIARLIDEFSSDIKNLYYQFEEERAERDKIKTHKLRNIVNSVLFELNNSFKDGWSYEQFEHEMKIRTGSGGAKVQDIFKTLESMKEVTELSPGLYRRIIGFDRY